jgi:hypothetical protein
MVAIWVGIVLLVLAAEDSGAYWLSERFMPLRKAHMLEEAIEGTFAPFSDPLFVAFQLVFAVSVFGFGAYVGARGASWRHASIVALAAVVTGALLIGDLLIVDGMPDSIRVVAYLCAGIYLAATAGGMALGVRQKPGRNSDG